MEDFNDLLLKLQEVHDREIEGLQVKVQELSNKKGCDTKRMEELYNRNQQMKEQQRLLTENIKTLENRLRAGLCDRCTVTQEVAKRRQQEYEASQITSLQHISLMATEINNLKKENKLLRDEIVNIRTALERSQSDHSSNSSTPAEVKHRSSPDLSPNNLPVALVSKALCTSALQPPDGDIAVKVEGGQRLEESPENRHLRDWHRSLFESYKPAITSLWKTQPRIVARRSQNEDEQHQIPRSVKTLSSSGPGADTHVSSRHVVHAPVPCRPQPLKSTPGTLPWVVGDPPDWASVSGQQPSQHSIPRFPNLIPSNQHINHANQRRHALGQMWHKPNQVQPPPTKEPTVVFRLRSLAEERQSKPQERPEGSSVNSAKLESHAVENKEAEGPLDLSDTGRARPDHRDPSPAAVPPEEVREDGDGDRNDLSEPVSSSSSPVTSGSTAVKSEDSINHKLLIKHLMQKDDVNVKPDKKVPVLTISLRPVVVLESLNSALQKQESSSSNQNSPDAEAGSSLEEKDEDEGRPGCKRKRAFVITDSDHDNTQHEQKVKITLRHEDKGGEI